MSTTYYITSSEYVGPNQEERFNSHTYSIHTYAPRTNMSHEVRTEGWLGTTNDVAEYAHGEFESEEAARAEIGRLLEDCGYREIDCSEPVGADGDELIYDVARFAVGRFEEWGIESTSTWCYEGIEQDVTADTTDERIEEIADEYEAQANSEGFSLHRRTIIKAAAALRDDLRAEREEDDE